MKIIYCGFGRAGLECLYQISNEAKLRSKDIIVFTHDTIENKAFIEHLNHLGIEFYFESVNEKYDRLAEFLPDVLVSVYYRFIISPDILELVNLKEMNLYPAVLQA